MTLRICLLFLLLSSCSCRPATTKEQDTIYGKVVSIADGDTFTMLLDNKTTIKVRDSLKSASFILFFPLKLWNARMDYRA